MRLIILTCLMFSGLLLAGCDANGDQANQAGVTELLNDGQKIFADTADKRNIGTEDNSDYYGKNNKQKAQLREPCKKPSH